MPINHLPSRQEKLDRMYHFAYDLIDILGKIQSGQGDTIDFYRRAFEFVWGAKLSTIQMEGKSPWNGARENLKSVWVAKNSTSPTHCEQ
jgi:hypothetical protein